MIDTGRLRRIIRDALGARSPGGAGRLRRLKSIGTSRALAIPLAFAGLAGVSCKTQDYPMADPETIAAWERSMRDAGRELTSGEGDAPPRPEVSPGDLAGDGSGTNLGNVACEDAGVCEGDGGVALACPGCLIAGECVGIAVTDGENPCQVCDPERDPRAWSANEGVTCDDGLFCTTNDACGGTVCTGQPRQCENGVTCDGVSICDEASVSCTGATNECGENASCNVSTGTCDTTCDGCLVAGICVPSGIEAPGNPCLVCNPLVSTTTLSPQDGVMCDDGAFCTVGDQCQSGQCVSSSMRACAAGRACNETANECQCQGCAVGGSCFPAGAANPFNPCQVCDPARSASAFSANTGASCGSGATDCSGQDTCNTQGQCSANHRPDGTPCSSQAGGSCAAGSCVAARQVNGTPCTAATQCLSGFCRFWFEDLDGDAFGNANRRAMLCSPAPDDDETSSRTSGALIPILRTATVRYSADPGDCCDAPNDAGRSMYPDTSGFFSLPQVACPEVDPFDYNCSGSLTDSFFNRTTTSFSCVQDGDCSAILWVRSPPACGETGSAQQCQTSNGVCSLAAATITATRLCR
jgi:hypothetical protein